MATAKKAFGRTRSCIILPDKYMLLDPQQIETQDMSLYEELNHTSLRGYNTV